MLRRCKLYAGDPNPRCVPDGWSPLPSGMISMLQGRLESVLFWCYNSGALSSRLLLWISCDDCSCKGWNVEHHILTFLWGLDPLGSNPVFVFNKKNMINMFNATNHSIMINEHELLLPLCWLIMMMKTSCDLLIGSILSISSHMNITNYDKRLPPFLVKAPTPFSIGTHQPHTTTTTSSCQVAARLAGRATAEDLPVPLPAAVLVQVAGMPCASGIRYSPWKWTAGTWKYTWKRNIIIHPPPFLGFEMLVLEGLYWSHYLDRVEGKGSLQVGGLLPPTYLGKWWKMDPIWKKNNIFFDWVETWKHQVVFDRKKLHTCYCYVFTLFFSPEMFSYHSPWRFVRLLKHFLGQIQAPHPKDRLVRILRILIILISNQDRKAAPSTFTMMCMLFPWL